MDDVQCHARVDPDRSATWLDTVDQGCSAQIRKVASPLQEQGHGVRSSVVGGVNRFRGQVQRSPNMQQDNAFFSSKPLLQFSAIRKVRRSPLRRLRRVSSTHHDRGDDADTSMRDSDDDAPLVRTQFARCPPITVGGRFAVFVGSSECEESDLTIADPAKPDPVVSTARDTVTDAASTIMDRHNSPSTSLLDALDHDSAREDGESARANFLLRVVSPDLVEHFAHNHDNQIWECLARILDVDLNQCEAGMKASASLPLSMGVLGLRSAVRTRVPAHWSSWADCFPMVHARHPDVAM